MACNFCLRYEAVLCAVLSTLHSPNRPLVIPLSSRAPDCILIPSPCKPSHDIRLARTSPDLSMVVFPRQVILFEVHKRYQSSPQSSEATSYACYTAKGMLSQYCVRLPKQAMAGQALI